MCYITTFRCPAKSFILSKGSFHPLDPGAAVAVAQQIYAITPSIGVISSTKILYYTCSRAFRDARATY